MQNEIVINALLGETRVALLEKSVFTELHIERDCETSVAGSVIKGRVARVLPGMQAAFVDIGLEKAAFLYAGDYFDGSAGNGEEPRRGRGRNGARREPPRIDSMLSEGQEIVVQVVKEPIGSKGARITSHISIAGRHLVLTPWSRRVGVSRRIDSDRERRRLRDIVTRLRPDNLGFIIRTVGDGVREADLEADIRYLSSVWEQIRTRQETSPAPAVLYAEPPLALKVIRDFANGDTRRVVIDAPEMHQQLESFVEKFVAAPQPKIEFYEGALPLFDHFDLESKIHANLQRKVWLKSGGSLIVDQSEALTAIDVNTGRFVGKRDLEDTVLKTNLEAVKEVVYQLRFRNIGGLIIIDLIDMETQENRDKVHRALRDALRSDKARTNILKISELGLVEMTRKRTRENLVQRLCEPCAFCAGRGYVLSRRSVAFRLLREIRKDLPRFSGRMIAVTVSPQVAEELLTTERDTLRALGESLGRQIEVRARPGVHQEQFEVTALDQGPPVEIPLSWLPSPKTEPEPEAEPKPQDEPELKPESEPEATPTAQPAEAASAPEPLQTGGEPVAELAAEAASPTPQAVHIPQGDGERAPEPLPAATDSSQPLDSEAESRILPPSEEGEGA